jgi:tripeptidyl-peptidase-1
MRVNGIAALAAVLGLTIAVPTSHVLHERRDLEVTAYTKRSPVPVGVELPVRIGLTQRNLDSAHDLLMEL